MSETRGKTTGNRVTNYAEQNRATDGQRVKLTPAQKKRNRKKNRRKLPGGKVHHKWTRELFGYPERVAK
jgi:hypothetical protein